MAEDKIARIPKDIVVLVEKHRQEVETFTSCLRRLLSLPDLVRVGKKNGRPRVYPVDTIEVGKTRHFPWHSNAHHSEATTHPVYRSIRYEESKGKKFRTENKVAGVFVTRVL